MIEEGVREDVERVEGIREALVIFNPSAGRARPAVLDRARKVLAADGIESELTLTDGPGAALEIARRAACEQRQMVIVCGGDGTLNEAVNGLAGSQIPLALLPAGTANILAKELELPWNAEKAAGLVARSRLRRIALGHVTTEKERQGRYFLSVGGAGPDGAIVNAVHRGLKAQTGTFAFWVEGLRQLVDYRFPRFRTTTAEGAIEGTFIVLGRTKHYGGPLRITTAASLFGNDFEILICTTESRWKYASYLPMVWAGILREAKGARFLRATTARCEPVGEEPVWVEVDGEAAGRLPAEFRIAPDALTLAVPELRN
jgi:diacylglycerol kinase (ATP)